MKNYIVTHASKSKEAKAKTEKCHTFVEALVPNGAERVKKVVQTLY